MTRVLLHILLLCFLQKLSAQGSDDSLIQSVAIEEAKDALYYQQQAKRAGSVPQALELLSKALSLRTAQQDESWVANVRVEMGSAFLKSGRIKAAFSEFLTADKLYASAKNHNSQAELHRIMARFYERNTSWNEAEKYYKSAQEHFEKSEDPGGAANVALHLADLFLVKKELSNAGPHIRYAAAVYEKLNDKTGVALAYLKQAEIHRRRRQFKKAESLVLTSALPMFRSSGYLAGRIECFDVLGNVYFDQKRYSEAKWFFIQANTQSKALNDTEGAIYSLVNLAKVKAQIGDLALAKKDIEEAQKLAKRRNSLQLLSRVKDGLAFVQDKAGNREQALMANFQSDQLQDSLDTYYTAQVAAAKVAKARPEPIVTKPAPKKSASNESSDRMLIAKLSALALGILFLIFLILKKIK
jgi:tetratricopeptide (TPR) repeat protein